jgi:hypothetical protein
MGADERGAQHFQFEKKFPLVPCSDPMNFQKKKKRF